VNSVGEMKEPRGVRGSPSCPRPRGYWAIGPADSHSLKRQHLAIILRRRLQAAKAIGLKISDAFW